MVVTVTMTMYWLLAVLLCVAMVPVPAAEVIFGYEDESQNMFGDWDFESEPSASGWGLYKCQAAKVTGGYEGGSAYKITARTKTSGSPQQKVTTGLKRDTNYYLSIFFKQLNNDASSTYTKARLFIKMRTAAGENINKEVGRLQYIMKDGVWKQLGGDFKTPDEDLEYMHLSLTVEPIGVEYLIDKASLIELEKRDDWETYLTEQSDTHRKADVFLKVNFPSGYDLSNTKVKVDLIRHKFGFGVAFKALLFVRTGEVNVNYRNFILDNFNWCGFENDMKWRQMEQIKGQQRVGKIDQSLVFCEDRNMSTRGHAVFWDIQDTNPDWVQHETGNSMKQELWDRITKAVDYYKDRVYEWDVCNEYLHRHFLEEATGVLDIIDQELTRVHQADPNTLLCLNDYEVLRNGILTSAQRNLATLLLDQGLPVHCVGAQAHLRTLPMDWEVLLKRLQIVASAGLPVSLTELSIHSDDEQLKADTMNKIFRTAYSVPLVHSITIWGFSDQPGFSFESDMHLTTGVNMVPNEAGQVMIDLIKSEWNTTLEFIPDEAPFKANFRATLGTYRVSVLKDGEVVTDGIYYADSNVSNQFRISV